MGLSLVMWASCDLCGDSKSFPLEDMSDPPYGFKWQPRLNADKQAYWALVCWDCYGE